MSFVLRQINLQFSKNGEVLLPLEGLKCTALISNPGGANAFATLQLRVYGMKLNEMNQFSSGGANLIINENIDITVLAGDVGGTIGQIFFGGIFSSYIDFSAVPDVAFVCSAQSGIFQKASPSAANSWKGSQNVEDIKDHDKQVLDEQEKADKLAHDEKNKTWGIEFKPKTRV